LVAEDDQDPNLTRSISVCSYLFAGNSFYDDGTNKEQYIANWNLQYKNGSTNNEGYKLLDNDGYKRYWPKKIDENETERKMEFFAIYPSPDEYQPSDSDKDNKFEWDYSSTNGPKINTKIETEEELQKDYLFAEQTVNSGGDVRLSFSHMMTAVTVQLADKLTSEYHVVSVSFSNIVKSATYDPRTKEWTPKARGTCTADFEDPYDTSLSHSDGGTTSMRAAGKEFFMIPQTFTQDENDKTWKAPYVSIVIYNKTTLEEKNCCS